MAKGELFEKQPASCRLPLPAKEIEFNDWYADKPQLVSRIKRVLFYDPAVVYLRIGHLIDPFKRTQSIGMDQIWPKLEKVCACGCGELAKADPDGKWQRKWHKDECSEFANAVLSIINNTFQVPSKYITYYAGKKCIVCDKDGAFEYMDLDHIVPVKHGGGGSWLSNYEWKCKTCHVDKTNKDFGRKQYKELKQI